MKMLKCTCGANGCSRNVREHRNLHNSLLAERSGLVVAGQVTFIAFRILECRLRTFIRREIVEVLKSVTLRDRCSRHSSAWLAHRRRGPSCIRRVIHGRTVIVRAVHCAAVIPGKSPVPGRYWNIVGIITEQPFTAPEMKVDTDRHSDHHDAEKKSTFIMSEVCRQFSLTRLL